MTLRWYSVVIDAHDIASLARWWAETLDHRIVYESADEVALAPSWDGEQPSASLEQWQRLGPTLVFLPVPEGKTVKNRIHLDLAPFTTQDRDGEIARLIERGARLVDVGQGPEVTWTVLADPEGNEFCVLSSRTE